MDRESILKGVQLQREPVDVPEWGGKLYVHEIDGAESLDVYTVGQELSPELFAVGEEVDVTGTSKGKGYAGVMKRHGFGGSRASHGAHRNHRSPGSIGACATPGHVFKGTRMAGRMGGDTVTTQNVSVHAVDVERGLILLKGAVPGPKGGLVIIRSAAKADNDANNREVSTS